MKLQAGDIETGNTEIVVNTRSLHGAFTGVQRYTSELLARLGEQVEVVSPRRPLHGVMGHAWEQMVLPLKLNGRLLWSPGNTGPLAVCNQLVTVHDTSALDHPEWFDSRFAAWYRFLLPRLVRRVRRVIADSEFTKSRLVATSGLNPDKVVVVPVGVDPRFRPEEADRLNEVVAALGLPSPRYVLSLGSLEPRKNLGHLLKAWEMAHKRMPDDVWLVVAGAKGKPMIFKDVELNDLPRRVILTGFVADELLPRLYAGALAFVYPSLYEGFGLPPLEAMACGTPVLTSNVASLPEVVGEAGIMVDPYDTEAIAEGLTRLVEDSALRDEMRRRGLERARLFSWERTAEETWKALMEAAVLRGK